MQSYSRFPQLKLLVNITNICLTGDIDSTPFGKIMSYYYLSHMTIRSMLTRARRTPQATFADALAWVSLATEFDDLPVRHNEDLMNAELANNLPLDTVGLLDGLPMWDPHVKAFLLLQAHMSRIDLPISDYVGDQTSVLDQTIRIAQAGVDLMTEMGRFGAVKEMIHLLQCVKSARWVSDYPLSLLPGVSEIFNTKLEGKVPKDLVTMVSLAHHQNSTAILDGLMNKLDIKGRGQFVKAVNTLPDISLAAVSVESSSISITISRNNALQDREGRIYAPRFPKPQTEGYFVLISPAGDRGDEILALKRASWPSNRQGPSSGRKFSSTVRLTIEPMELQRRVDVLVMSDAYPGMQWIMKDILVPAMEKEKLLTVEVHVDAGMKDGKSKEGRDGSGLA